MGFGFAQVNKKYQKNRKFPVIIGFRVVLLGFALFLSWFFSLVVSVEGSSWDELEHALAALAMPHGEQHGSDRGRWSWRMRRIDAGGLEGLSVVSFYPSYEDRAH